jgi:phytoene synthase
MKAATQNMPADQSRSIPPLQRLALAYAPAKSRAPLIALFALDARLADIVRHAHEPMLAQLRLAWWREQLTGGSGGPASGDPLLALLREWLGSDDWPAAVAVVSLPGAGRGARARVRRTCRFT